MSVSMIRNWIFCSVFTAGFLIPAVNAVAQDHIDLSARLNAAQTKVLVGGWLDGTGDQGVQNPPVFGFDLSQVGNNWLEGDPGHNSPPTDGDLIQGGRVLPVGVQLRSNLYPYSIPGNAAVSNLWFWDGSTMSGMNPVFTPVSPANGITMVINRSSTNITADGTTTSDSFLSWGARADGSALHSPHASTLLSDVDLTLPPAGVYMTMFDFEMTGYQSSDKFLLLYNAGLSEPIHDVAIDWAAANFSGFQAIPEPGTWALLVCGLGAVGFWGGKKMRRQIPAAC